MKTTQSIIIFTSKFYVDILITRITFYCALSGTILALCLEKLDNDNVARTLAWWKLQSQQ